MKIGFLAMSGVRVHDPELAALGLTLPAFVRRGQVIASLPSLGLLNLAACTPAGHELLYFEADSAGAEPVALYDCNLVAISTFSAQVFEAYRIADRLRTAGVKVAMGGLHVSVLPHEALAHADYVIVGEGENVWPATVAAAMSNAPAQVFESSRYPPVDVARLPVPRYDLLQRAGRQYNRYTVQTSRGCPWRCDFCASTVMLDRPYRKRPIDGILRDIRAVQSRFRRPFIEFADDNTFVDKRWGADLCDAITPLQAKWFTETDVTVAQDPDLLARLWRAGCRQLLIGLESPGSGPLEGVELRSNFKARSATDHAKAIRAIQRHGITVNGCFVLGLDGHTTNVFQEVLDFVEEVGLYEVQITVMTPFPGTPLYTRLLQEGRILEPRRWDLCTLFDVNFRPAGMSVETLREGMRWLTERLYDADAVRRRRRRFLKQRSEVVNRHGRRLRG